MYSTTGKISCLTEGLHATIAKLKLYRQNRWIQVEGYRTLSAFGLGVNSNDCQQKCAVPSALAALVLNLRSTPMIRACASNTCIPWTPTRSHCQPAAGLSCKPPFSSSIYLGTLIRSNSNV